MSTQEDFFIQHQFAVEAENYGAHSTEYASGFGFGFDYYSPKRAKYKGAHRRRHLRNGMVIWDGESNGFVAVTATGPYRKVY